MQMNSVVNCHVIDANVHDMGPLACHGILLGSILSHHTSRVIKFGHIDQWVVVHHALVHAVKCQALAIGAPEQTAVNAELAAMNALAIDHLARAIGSHLTVTPCRVGDIKVVIHHIGHGTTLIIPLQCLGIGVAILFPLHCTGLEIDEHALFFVGQQHKRLVSIRESGRFQASDLAVV